MRGRKGEEGGGYEAEEKSYPPRHAVQPHLGLSVCLIYCSLPLSTPDKLVTPLDRIALFTPSRIAIDRFYPSYRSSKRLDKNGISIRLKKIYLNFPTVNKNSLTKYYLLLCQK